MAGHSARPSAAGDPLPKKELSYLWFIHMSQGFQVTMLFPMIVFMVQDYGAVGDNHAAVGRYAGFLACLFPFAQFCTSVLWGSVSDRTGRKPVLILGNLASLLSAAALGLTMDYATACIIRTIGGLLNGVITTTKVILSEISNSTNQAKAFSVLPLAWGIGTILGSIVGGMAARPCQQYSLDNCPPILLRYPYLAPCSIASLVSLSALVSSILIRETKAKDQRPYQDPSSRSSSRLARLLGLGSTAGVRSEEDQRLVGVDVELQDTATASSPPTKSGMAKIGDTESAADEEFGKGASSWSDEKGHFAEEKGLLADKGAGAKVAYWRDRNVLLTSWLYAFIALTYIIHDELFPIYAASLSSVGGLGLSSSAIGLLGAGGGVLLFFITGLVIRINPSSSLLCVKLGCLLGIPAAIAFPAASLFPSLRTLKWGALLVATALKTAAALISFNGALVLVSNSASPDEMGAVTGLSHSLSSFMRGVGPALGGSLWSFSAGLHFPYHQFLAWGFVLAMTALTLGLSCVISSELDIPRIERTQGKSSLIHARERRKHGASMEIEL